MKIKVKLVGKGTDDDPYTVNLPTWTMIGNADYEKKRCYVLIPDDEIKIEEGKRVINQDRIKEKYKKGWGHFKASEVMVDE